MLNRHKDELSLEWDKRWEHLQLGKTAWFDTVICPGNILKLVAT